MTMVYFRKTNPAEFQLWPVPIDVENYYPVEIPNSPVPAEQLRDKVYNPATGKLEVSNQKINAAILIKRRDAYREEVLDLVLQWVYYNQGDNTQELNSIGEKIKATVEDINTRYPLLGE